LETMSISPRLFRNMFTCKNLPQIYVRHMAYFSLFLQKCRSYDEIKLLLEKTKTARCQPVRSDNFCQVWSGIPTGF